MFNQTAFGEKLKNHRKSKNLTQEEVAERIGVSGQAVSKWEKGECLPDCYNLKMLGNVYQVSVDSLLDVEEIATVDTLTGIFNKRHFLDFANILIERARRHQENCYLLMLDMDKFESINDTHGHDAGDKVLIEFAARIKSQIRRSDLFARFGGEEFIVFMTDTDDAGVNTAAERLRLSICGSKFDCCEVILDVSVSIGVSKIIDFGMEKAIHNSMEKAIANADSAMYTAKKDGRNRVAYFEQ
ncbi:MAG: diguanylate cyclase [Oscillospiraceae bacterium]|nr:diguanylate cyclase [Oscillospiraceae bacterium]